MHNNIIYNASYAEANTLLLRWQGLGLPASASDVETMRELRLRKDNF